MRNCCDANHLQASLSAAASFAQTTLQFLRKIGKSSFNRDNARNNNNIIRCFTLRCILGHIKSNDKIRDKKGSDIFVCVCATELVFVTHSSLPHSISRERQNFLSVIILALPFSLSHFRVPAR